MESNLIWSDTLDFKIERMHSASLFEIISMKLAQNFTLQSSISNLLHVFWNHKIQSLKTSFFFSLYKHFIDQVLSKLGKICLSVIFLQLFL